MSESADRFKRPTRPLSELLAEQSRRSKEAIVAMHRRELEDCWCDDRSQSTCNHECQCIYERSLYRDALEQILQTAWGYKTRQIARIALERGRRKGTQDA